MRRVGCGLVLALTGCSALEDRDALVLLDAAARDAGHTIEVAGVDRTSPLPVAIPAGEAFEIYSDDDVRTYELFAGEVLRLRGDAVEFGFLDEDLSPHTATIDADEWALEELSYLTGAERDLDLGATLTSEGLLRTLADLDAPDGLREVHTLQSDASTLESATSLGVLHTTGVGRSHSTTVRHTITLTFADPSHTPTATPAKAQTPAAPEPTGLFCNPLHVGVYASGDACIILDAGGDAQVCGDNSRRLWTSEGDTVILHELTGPVTLSMRDGADRVEFPGGRTMVRLGAQ